MIRSARMSIIAALALGIPSIALAQTGYYITGGMSNFDCTNKCDHDCDEFEVEIEGIHPEDVIHTYRNGNYGSPTITLSADGSKTIVDYRNPSHPTAVNSIEHFGIHLRQLVSANAVHGRWYRAGRPATVNGQIPDTSGSSTTGTTPATQPMMPSINVDLTNFAISERLTVTVTNVDTTQPIWIQRRATITTGVVTLEALMTNDPVITTTLFLDASPISLPAGASISYNDDLIEVEDNQSGVFAVEYFQDILIPGGGGLFGGNDSHVRGPSLGNVMTASIASPDTCPANGPIIIDQPISQEGQIGDSIDLRIDADDLDLTTTFQWMHEGLAISDNELFSGTDGDELSLELQPQTQGMYQCIITNACGQSMTKSALVFIAGQNVAPIRIACRADYNASGNTSVQDIFDFLSGWFAGDMFADTNASGEVSVQDIFDFLSAWFVGC